jgi:ParB family chromosome partitioning protein
MREQIKSDGINELAESIRRIGLLQPIVVCSKGDKYEIIAGHRRYLAHRQLKADTIKCIYITASADESLTMRYAENAIREDIDVVDESIYLSKIRESRHCTIVELATLVGRSKSYVAERLDIMNYHHKLLEALCNEQISYSIARVLHKCKDPEMLEHLLQCAVTSGCSVRVAQDWVKDANLDSEPYEHPEDSTVDEQQAVVDSPSKLMTICSLCARETDNKLIKILYVCPDCCKLLEL